MTIPCRSVSAALSLACLLLLLPGATRAQDSIDEVMITGTRVGPRLWRVADSTHTLWILGTVEQLPKKMTWQSERVDALLGETQLVIPANGNLDFHAGPLAAVRLYFQWRGVQTNPDHATLNMVLPGPLYARFAALKNQYAAHDPRLEHLRPMVAAAHLYRAAESASGLGPGRIVQDTVLKLAHYHRVTVARLSVDVEDPRGLLSQLAQLSAATEIRCLEATMSRLETDLGPMRLRANAWAIGDVAALRRLPAPDNRAICLDAASSAPGIQALVARAAAQWLDTALASLRSNRVTLALRPINDLLAPDGVLATFRARGYSVEEP